MLLRQALSCKIAVSQSVYRNALKNGGIIALLAVLQPVEQSRFCLVLLNEAISVVHKAASLVSVQDIALEEMCGVCGGVLGKSENKQLFTDERIARVVLLKFLIIFQGLSSVGKTDQHLVFRLCLGVCLDGGLCARVVLNNGREGQRRALHILCIGIDNGEV